MNKIHGDIKHLFNDLLSDKKRTIILILSFIGIILIVISSFTDNDKNNLNEEIKNTPFSEDEYTLSLETKLENLISSLNGAGRTKVSVTLECDYEVVYARDGSYSQKNGATDEENKYIIIDSEKNEQGLVLKTVTPKVRGVAVLCEGGDLPGVQSSVIMMLEALLDVGSNHISVAKIQ